MQVQEPGGLTVTHRGQPRPGRDARGAKGNEGRGRSCPQGHGLRLRLRHGRWRQLPPLVLSAPRQPLFQTQRQQRPQNLNTFWQAFCSSGFPPPWGSGAQDFRAGRQELELHQHTPDPSQDQERHRGKTDLGFLAAAEGHSLGAPSPLPGTQASSPHPGRVFLGENGVPGVSGSQIGKTMDKESAPNQEA